MTSWNCRRSMRSVSSRRSDSSIWRAAGHPTDAFRPPRSRRETRRDRGGGNFQESPAGHRGIIGRHILSPCVETLRGSDPAVVPSPAPGGAYANLLNVRPGLELGLLVSLSTAAPLGIHARGLIGLGRLLLLLWLLLGPLPGTPPPTTTAADGSALPAPALSFCRPGILRVYRVIGHLGRVLLLLLIVLGFVSTRGTFPICHLAFPPCHFSLSTVFAPSAGLSNLPSGPAWPPLQLKNRSQSL